MADALTPSATPSEPPPSWTQPPSTTWRAPLEQGPTVVVVRAVLLWCPGHLPALDSTRTGGCASLSSVNAEKSAKEADALTLIVLRGRALPDWMRVAVFFDGRTPEVSCGERQRLERWTGFEPSTPRFGKAGRRLLIVQTWSWH